MRVSLPLPLTVSLALHVGLLTAVVLSFIPRESSPVGTTAQADAPSILLMRAKAVVAMASKQAAATKPAATVSLAKPVALPSPPIPPLVEKPALIPATTMPPALAVEADPNAHIRAVAPDSILSPNPPPRLNSRQAVVFILDISGSMYEPFAGSTRIALARQTLSQQIAALKNGTPFAITLYALNATNSGPLVAASDATREAAVRFLMRDVDCGGGTNLPIGLNAAVALHTGAIVLATDGDLNISMVNLKARARVALGGAGHGPALTIVGVGPRADTTASGLLQSLADLQGGTYQVEQSADETALLNSEKAAQ